MSTVIRECFGVQFANDRPLTFLLKLIWLGALSDCIDLIRPLCFDELKDDYVRTLAVRAAGKCEAKDLLNDIARSAAMAAMLWPTKLLGTVVEECFPDHCSLADLEKLIRRASQATKDRDGLQGALEYVCAASTLPELVGSDLVRLLSRLLIEGKASLAPC